MLVALSSQSSDVVNDANVLVTNPNPMGDGLFSNCMITYLEKELAVKFSCHEVINNISDLISNCKAKFKLIQM